MLNSYLRTECKPDPPADLAGQVGHGGSSITNARAQELPLDDRDLVVGFQQLTGGDLTARPIPMMVTSNWSVMEVLLDAVGVSCHVSGLTRARARIPQLARVDAPGSKRTTSVADWKAFGGAVIGSTPRLRRRRCESGRLSPVNSST
jgi:hypothetical protein